MKVLLPHEAFSGIYFNIIIQEVFSMKKLFTKDLLTLWLTLAALICAALKLNSSLNKLGSEDQQG